MQPTPSHLDLMIKWVQSWQVPHISFGVSPEVYHLFTDEFRGVSSLPLLKMLGVVVIFFLVCKGIHSFQERVKDEYDYPLFDWCNIFIHTGMWILAFLMMAGDCWGFWGVRHGWPVTSTLVLLLIFAIPVYRTHSRINNIWEAIFINLFQTIFGFIIGGLLFFIMAFNSHSKKNN
jgi:hypothetical protein